MKKSESLVKFAPAFLSAQKRVDHAVKNAQNAHLKNKYADLAQVIDTVIPVFNGEGISILQFPGFSDGRATLTTVVLHESGEYIEGTAETPLGKQGPQELGGGLTYLARYSLARIGGIAQEDDDGETAKGKPEKPKADKSTPQDVRETAKAASKEVSVELLKKALLDELKALEGREASPAEVSGFQERLRALHQLNKELGMAVYGLARKQGVLE